MEWSIRESGVRYTAKLSDSEGTLSLAGLTRDGHEAPHSEIGITRDSQGARLLVDIDGSAHIANVAKVGDDWWIHINGESMSFMVTNQEALILPQAKVV